MKIVKNKLLPPKTFSAITILNMIFIRRGTLLSKVEINHERIHFEQEKELLFVFFYLIYVFEFFIRLAFCWKWKTAYYQISFEKEAYSHQKDLNYISKRKHYAWIKGTHK